LVVPRGGEIRGGYFQKREETKVSEKKAVTGLQAERRVLLEKKWDRKCLKGREKRARRRKRGEAESVDLDHLKKQTKQAFEGRGRKGLPGRENTKFKRKEPRSRSSARTGQETNRSLGQNKMEQSSQISRQETSWGELYQRRRWQWKSKEVLQRKTRHRFIGEMPMVQGEGRWGQKEGYDGASNSRKRKRPCSKGVPKDDRVKGGSESCTE